MKILAVIAFCLISYILPLNTTSQTKLDINISINDSTEIIQIATNCYDIYLKGVEAEYRQDIIAACRHYNDFLAIKNRPQEIALVEIDLYARLASIYYSQNNFESVCSYCQKAISMDASILNQFKGTAYVFITYVTALTALNRCDEIDKIIAKGQKYVEKAYPPTKKEYYWLKFLKSYSFLCIQDYERAQNSLDELKASIKILGLNVMDDEIATLSTWISNMKELNSPLYNKTKFIDEITQQGIMLTLTAPHVMADKGASIWNLLLSQINKFLQTSYFDIENISDEKLWSKLIYYYGVFINSFCKWHDIYGRDEHAYDYILTCKNFLDWHSLNINKKPIKWRDVKSYLNDDEVAIEIVPFAREILVLRNNYIKPQVIKVDSILMDEISSYNQNEPYDVNEFYKSGSPICEFVELLESRISDCKKIYISASNTFSLYNYGIVPYKDGKLDDYFDVIQMLTTADILDYKTNRTNNSFEILTLFGGIDYDNVKLNNESITSVNKNLEYNDNMSSDMRKGYGYLPHSLEEVLHIGKLCNKYNISYNLYTGVNATKQALKKSLFTKPSVLQIATHSFLLPSYKYKDITDISELTNTSRLATIMSNTGLMFAGANNYLKQGRYLNCDEILTAKEIANLNLSNVKLVTLSCCSSAFGDLSNVNGVVYGLVSAFKSSGASQLLVSLWDVPDYTTSIFMQAFYTNLLRGYDTQSSLKYAKSTLISKGYTDPYYWGAYVILN